MATTLVSWVYLSATFMRGRAVDCRANYKSSWEFNPPDELGTPLNCLAQMHAYSTCWPSKYLGHAERITWANRVSWRCLTSDHPKHAGREIFSATLMLAELSPTISHIACICLLSPVHTFSSVYVYAYFPWNAHLIHEDCFKTSFRLDLHAALVI